VPMGEKRKELRDQLRSQSQALLQLLKPLPEMNLQIEAIGVFADEETETLTDDKELASDRIRYQIMSYSSFVSFLDDLPDGSVLRVSQSELLRRLRQGVPSPELGHPDFRDAIDYHRRVRLTLDFGLFRHFSPTLAKWAINGTAGMGKSVLLAYAVCVLSTDRTLAMSDTGVLSLSLFDTKGKGLPPLEDRRIVVYSLKEKQRRVVEFYWKLLIEMFQDQDPEGQLRIQKPAIKLWQRGEDVEGNVLLIDEAHDLTVPEQESIAAWVNQKGERRYLIIACDRHQKLRLVDAGEQERMISGLHFGGCTTKLKRVYRNPFSVYAAGLALMFRWYAPQGEKVVPNEAQLKESFGFKVDRRDVKAGLGCSFSVVEDAHPANQWNHCVADFPDAATAQSWLDQYKLNAEDVLWVRFTKEDPDFDYEQFGRYQYHNLNCVESSELIDKYIKGQEFSVVVIEGVGSRFNDLKNPKEMYLHRRELYLCASRATVFFFFIHNPNVMDEAEIAARTEIHGLLGDLARPKSGNATKFWGVDFKVDNGSISLSEFEDIVEEEEGSVLGDGAAKQIDTDESTSAETTQTELVEVASKELEDSNGKTNHSSNGAVETELAVGENAGQMTDYEDRKPSELGVAKDANIGKRAEPEFALNQGGFTVLDSYTPRILADYLDIKVFKVTKELLSLMPSEEIHLNVRLSLEVVERVCDDFGKPHPWLHKKLGNWVRAFELQGKIVTVRDLAARLSGNGCGKKKAIEKRLADLGFGKVDDKEPVSAYGFYVLLKEFKHPNPDSILKRMKMAESHLEIVA